MDWVNVFHHPLPIGAYIQAEVPPCGTCAKVRSMIPGAPQLKPSIFEGKVEFVFVRNSKYWYKISTGRLIEHNHVKFVRSPINN